MNTTVKRESVIDIQLDQQALTAGGRQSVFNVKTPLIAFILGLVLSACGGGAAPAASSPAPTSASAKPVPTSASAVTPSAAPSAIPATTASVAAQPAPSGAQVVVKTGVLGILPDAPIYIALERGYFAEQGLKVETTKFNTAADMIAPLATGQLDVGEGTPGAGLFNAITRELPIRIVADNARISPNKSHIALLKRKDDTSLKDYADLKGKRVSLNARGGGPEVELARALAKANLTLKDVDIKVVPFPDVNTALANKSIDVGYNLEPFVTLGLLKTDLAVFKYVGDFYPNDQVAVLLYSPKTVQNKDVGNRFMVAYIKALRDYYNAFFKNQGRGPIVDILAKDTAVKDPSLYDKMPPYLVDPNGGVNMDSLSYDLNWLADNGYVKQKPDLKEVVDSSFVQAAVDKLGKVQP